MITEDERPVYIIYRVYRSGPIKTYQYAWTKNKNLAKMFLLQRTEDKFKVIRTSEEELAAIYSENGLEKELELHLKEVYSVTGRKVPLAITLQEMAEAKLSLRKTFGKLCSPAGRIGKFPLDSQMEVFQRLKPEILEVLDDLGFWPPEMKSLFDSVEDNYPPPTDLGLYAETYDGTPDWVKCLCSLEGLVFALKENF